MHAVAISSAGRMFQGNRLAILPCRPAAEQQRDRCDGLRRVQQGDAEESGNRDGLHPSLLRNAAMLTMTRASAASTAPQSGWIVCL